MRKELLIVIVVYFIHHGLVVAQCPDATALAKRIAFLRDSSGLSPYEQITELGAYDIKFAACLTDQESLHEELVTRLAKLYMAAGNFQKGVDYFLKSIALGKLATSPRSSMNNRPEVVRYYWLSALYDSLRNVPEKMRALDSCAAVAIRLNRIDAYCLWALYNRAEYCFDIGDYSRSINFASLCETLALEFVKMKPQLNSSYGVRYAFSSLLWNVNSLLLLKKTDEAKNLLESKVAESKSNGFEQYLGAIYALLVEVYILKNDYQTALHYHEKGFTIEQKSGQSFNCKAMLNMLAYDIYFKHQNDPEKALRTLGNALDYKVADEDSKVENSMESLSILERMANVYVSQKKYVQAVSYIQQAFNQVKEGITETELLNMPLDEFIRQRRIGNIATLIIDKAILFHEKFKSSNDPADIRNAIRIYKIADQFLEKIKTEQLEPRSKLFWRSDRRRLYELAIEACYENHSYDDAFYFFERGRAVLLYDQLNEYRIMDKEDIRQQAVLKKRILQLENELSGQNNSASVSRRLQAELLLNRQDLDHLNNRIKNRNPLFYESSIKPSEISLSTVRHNLLADNDRLLEFFEGDSAVYTILISPKEENVYKINADSFYRHVNLYTAYISDFIKLNREFDKFLKISGELFHLIFGGVKLKPGKIIVSPDFHFFPMEALITGEGTPPQYLIETHPVSYIHSALILMSDFNDGEKSKSRNFLGVAPVNYNAELNMPALKGSDISLKYIGSNFWDVNYLLYDKATRNNFLRDFSSYKVIQLYTHASDNLEVSEPEIYFADTALRLSELISGEKSNTRLIVISACESGTGQWHKGEGIFSFNRGFTSLGISSIITNLWSVDDKSTYRLTELFYAELANGEPIDVALQKAKLNLIHSSKEKSLPYFWAACVLAGKTEAPIIYRPFPWIPLLFIIFTAGFIIYYLLVRVNKKSPNYFLGKPFN